MPLSQFPVSSIGRPTFSDDFGAPRSGGRRHEGTDIFAPEGTPLLAVDAGVVGFVSGSLGGNIARLKANDGTTYLYTHLSRFAGALGDPPRRVAAGDVVGFVGTTGNAQGTSPHVHFEVHPPGSGPVNPFPLLKALQAGEAQPAIAKTPSDGGAAFALLLLLWALSQSKVI